MPRGSEELTNARKEEIVNACAAFYATMSFKDITLRDIGNKTSFTRTSIYNYFQTKEEIFLALLKREHDAWITDMNEMIQQNTYAEAFDTLEECLEKFFPFMTEKDRKAFLYAFFPFLFGIHPFTSHTEKQLEAMKQAGIKEGNCTIYELTKPFLLRLLKSFL